MTKKIPVKICKAKHKAKRNPKFHKYEILDGWGESIKYELANRRTTCDFKILIVKKKNNL